MHELKRWSYLIWFPILLVKMCYVMHRSGILWTLIMYKAALCLTQWQASCVLLETNMPTTQQEPSGNIWIMTEMQLLYCKR